MASPSPDVRALPPGSVVGNYIIQSVLGQGGFGITYLAEHQKLKRKTALKECLPTDLATRDGDTTIIPLSESLKPTFEWAVESFIQEAQFLASFEHPNIVPVHEVFDAHGTGYMATKFIEGQSIHKWVYAYGDRISPKMLEATLFPVLDALETIHAENVIHRDLKPANILVTPSAQPILIDFGSARQSVGGRSRTMTSVVTPGYAPLEQYDNANKQGPFTDLYALGATFHQLLRGKAPQDASVRILDDGYESLAEDPELAGYPRHVLEALDQALEPMPKNRPQSVAEFRALIQSELPQKPAVGFTQIGSAATQLMAKDPKAPESSDFLGDTIGNAQTQLAPQKSVTETPAPPPLSPLDKPEPQKKKSRLPLIAACLVVFAALGFWFINRDTSDPDVEPISKVDDSEPEEPEVLVDARLDSSIFERKGSVIVRSNPGTRVTATSQAGSFDFGTTDAQGTLLLWDKVVIGDYDFRLEKAGYTTQVVRDLEVTQSEPTEIEVTLVPESGVLKVRVTPRTADWEMFIDGEPRTDGPNFKLPAGKKYTVEVRSKQFETVVKEATVEADEETLLNVSLFQRKVPQTGEAWTVSLPEGVPLKMEYIPAGSFLMGSDRFEKGHMEHEKLRTVTISDGFWMAAYETTQKQWRSITLRNPSGFAELDKELPVENVTWYQAMAFCKELTELEKKAGRLPDGYIYTLPTEAQWEYACRAGTRTALNNGTNLTSENQSCPNLDKLGWYYENSDKKTHLVGQLESNAWGLYDMHGNVWEWCYDWLADYAAGPIKDPAGPMSGRMRVTRGGSWLYFPKNSRSAARFGSEPDSKTNTLGFRVVLAPEPQPSKPSRSSTGAFPWSQTNKEVVSSKTPSKTPQQPRAEEPKPAPKAPEKTEDTGNAVVTEIVAPILRQLIERAMEKDNEDK